MDVSGSCIKCGYRGKLYSNLCEKCFREEELKKGFIDLPEHIDAILCPKCNSAKIGSKWFDFPNLESALEKSVASSIGIRRDLSLDDVELDISLEYMHEKLYKARVNAIIHHSGLEFEESKETELRIRYAACDRCSKVYGGYFEAIVQVRASDRKINSNEGREVREFVNMRLGELRKSSRSVFITKEEEVQGGIDFYVGSIDAAKQIAKSLQDEFGGEYTESSKLHTRKEGRDIYRMTYLVRFPKYRRRDIIAMKIKGKEKVLQVKKIYPKMAWLKDLTTGKDVNIDVSELENVRIIGGPESIQEAVVVSRNKVNKGFELQILEPTTYRTVTIREPEDFQVKGQYVKIVKYDEQIFLIYD